MFLFDILPDNDSRAEVKVLPHDVEQLPFALVGRPVMEDGNGQRMGDSDGVRHLLQHRQHVIPSSQPSQERHSSFQ